MSVENSLAYQRKFFSDFSSAWADHSYYRLYAGIDHTAETLRLDIHEVPGYILAYDKSAQQELHHFLRENLIKWLRDAIPFFEISDDGRIFFGDWYHRREFGSLDVFARSIVHQNEAQQDILPHLSQFANDPDHYLDAQIEHLRKTTYQRAADLHHRLESLENENEAAAPTTERQSNNGSGFRGLLKNFIDPEETTTPSQSSPSRHTLSDATISKVRREFEAAKETADQKFDSEKRQMQVAAAVTRYEYQAVMNHYSSIDQFINALTNLRKNYMKALKQAEEAK